LHKLCWSFGKIIIIGWWKQCIIVTPDADIKMTVIGAVLELWELQDKDVLQPVV
jgi:hypothetical protein